MCIRDSISLYYGPSAWKEIVHIEAQMRKERKEAIYKAEERKQLIIEWIVGILFASAMAGLIAFIVYFLGKANGAW